MADVRDCILETLELIRKIIDKDVVKKLYGLLYKHILEGITVLVLCVGCNYGKVFTEFYSEGRFQWIKLVMLAVFIFLTVVVLVQQYQIKGLRSEIANLKQNAGLRQEKATQTETALMVPRNATPGIEIRNVQENTGPSPGQENETEDTDCYDALILHDNSDETKTMVYEYKTHLERDLQMENVQVELIDDIGIGKTHFNTMEKVFDKYRHFLIFLTPNFTNDTLNHFKMQMCLDQSLRDPDKQGRIIPVWTAEINAEDCPGELSVLNGINYWEFYDVNHKTFYIKKMQDIIRKGRKS